MTRGSFPGLWNGLRLAVYVWRSTSGGLRLAWVGLHSGGYVCQSVSAGGLRGGLRLAWVGLRLAWVGLCCP